MHPPGRYPFAVLSKLTAACSAQHRQTPRRRSCTQAAAANAVLSICMMSASASKSKSKSLGAAASEYTRAPELERMRPSTGARSQCAFRSLRQPAAAQAASEGWMWIGRL